MGLGIPYLTNVATSSIEAHRYNLPNHHTRARRDGQLGGIKWINALVFCRIRMRLRGASGCGAWKNYKLASFFMFN